jgi:SAM-dependent methyltransferase
VLTLSEDFVARNIGNWYDYPQYFDLGFSDETATEADFFVAAAERYAQHDVKRWLEPGFGGGRLVVEMARRGFDLTGFDNNAAALRYVQGRLKRAVMKADLFLADLADFHVSRPVDGAFCTFNTFRHLLSEEAALAHLRCVASAVAPGGIYILGMHLLPPDASEECLERSARRGQTKVTFTLRVTATDRRRRQERLKVNMLVRTARRELRLATEFPLRMYTAAQFKRLLAEAREWQLCDVFDFWYEIEHPLALNNELSDAVFVLRRQ